MSDSPRRFRTPSRLSPALNQRLNLYALMAGAAGVSVLALGQPAEARIIYTKTHNVIGTNGIYGLDLNHDGILDFLIQEHGFPFSSSGYNGLGAKAAFGNAVVGSNGLAAALSSGAPIGPGQHFISTTSAFGEVMFNVACSIEQGCSTIGKWGQVSNRYLGLKFTIKGEPHYGWARVSVQVQARSITATLTGYAYETVANQGLKAGETSSKASMSDSSSKQSELPNSIIRDSQAKSQTVQPKSLAWLALGSGRP